MKEGRLPLPSRLHILQRVAGALRYLHLKGLGHYDIKPDNVMYSGSQVKLVDLGLTQPFDSSPEVLDQRFYSARQEDNLGPSADILAYGLLANYLFTGKGHQLQEGRPLLEQDSPFFGSLIEQCTGPAPSRPSAEHILLHLGRFRELAQAPSDAAFAMQYYQLCE
jgi:serine/threonine-protein kinase PknG